MKTLISSILVIFLFFTNQAFSEQKIAFIDMDIVISTSKSGSSMLKQYVTKYFQIEVRERELHIKKIQVTCIHVLSGTYLSFLSQALVQFQHGLPVHFLMPYPLQ